MKFIICRLCFFVFLKKFQGILKGQSHEIVIAFLCLYRIVQKFFNPPPCIVLIFNLKG
jgi:hypothetical protein